METCLLTRLRRQYSWAKQVRETSPIRRHLRDGE
jgi:hypothetical protein